MPNWCLNRLDIYSEDPAEMKLIYDSITDDKGQFTFATLVPMPEVLEGTTSGGYVDVGMAILDDDDEFLTNLMTRWRWLEEREGVTTVEAVEAYFREKTKAVKEAKASRAAAEETGFSNWYDWRIANWGCKWDASTGDDTVAFDEGDEEISVAYQTPWGPPEAFIEALRETFPSASITAFYDEPGMQFAGYL